MFNQTFFHEAASALVVIEPFLDKVLAVNVEAAKLLSADLDDLTTTRASQLFSANFPDFIVFSEELLAKQCGWSDHLVVKTKQGPSRVEVQGKKIIVDKKTMLILSLQQRKVQEKRRIKSDAEQHFLSGLGEWNRAAQAFLQFERENNLLLNAAGEGIYGIDANGLTTFVNPAAERILGYKASELSQLNMHQVIHHSHIDGSHSSAECCPIYNTFKKGKVYHVEDDVFWSKDKKPINVEYTSTPIRDNGFIIGAVVIFRDVSQKKEDKKKLIAALEEVSKLKHRLELENAYLQEELNSEFNHHQIIGRSSAVQTLLKQIELVSPTNATVLINGESGTGKELIARAIHDTSNRKNRALIRVNCAAIPQDLFESEFFGHSKGAFTGATGERPGRFELADGGTLFLDEVGEIPIHLQGKLLRVLQEQQFERVGDSKTRHVDVRIVAATNRNLIECVQNGTFREDLYFRLNVFPIQSAPLRQRKEDIPLLIQHFVNKAAKLTSRTNIKVPMSEIEKLQAYHWPGNIRELENVIERQIILTQSDTLRFPHILDNNVTQIKNPPINTKVEEILTEQDILELDKSNIVNALKRCKGKVSGQDGASELLQLKPTTLSSRIKKYGISPSDFKLN